MLATLKPAPGLPAVQCSAPHSPPGRRRASAPPRRGRPSAAPERGRQGPVQSSERRTQSCLRICMERHPHSTSAETSVSSSACPTGAAEGGAEGLKGIGPKPEDRLLAEGCMIPSKLKAQILNKISRSSPPHHLEELVLRVVHGAHTQALEVGSLQLGSGRTAGGVR